MDYVSGKGVKKERSDVCKKACMGFYHKEAWIADSIFYFITIKFP